MWGSYSFRERQGWWNCSSEPGRFHREEDFNCWALQRRCRRDSSTPKYFYPRIGGNHPAPLRLLPATFWSRSSVKLFPQEPDTWVTERVQPIQLFSLADQSGVSSSFSRQLHRLENENERWLPARSCSYLIWPPTPLPLNISTPTFFIYLSFLVFCV